MTLRQEAYAVIDSLPDDDRVKFFIDMIRRFNAVAGKTEEISDNQNFILEKRQAFLHMEELKKKYPFTKEYDCEQIRREAMEEKYGCINTLTLY